LLFFHSLIFFFFLFHNFTETFPDTSSVGQNRVSFTCSEQPLLPAVAVTKYHFSDNKPSLFTGLKVWHPKLYNKDNLCCFCSFRPFSWVLPTLFAEFLMISTEDCTCPSRPFFEDEPCGRSGYPPHSSLPLQGTAFSPVAQPPAPSLLPRELQTNSTSPQSHLSQRRFSSETHTWKAANEGKKGS